MNKINHFVGDNDNVDEELESSNEGSVDQDQKNQDSMDEQDDGLDAD